MSGKDERKLIEVPACPNCEKVPDYWTLYGDNDDKPVVGWILSDEYLEKYSDQHKHVLIERSANEQGILRILEGLRYIRCVYTPAHTFRKGSVMFNKLKTVIERYHAREGHQVE